MISQNKTTIHQQSKALIENSAKLKTTQSQYNSQIKIIQAYSDKKSKEVGIIKQTNGSITQLSAALSINKKAYSNLTKQERENEQIGGKLLKLIKNQDKEYKTLQKSIGNNQVEVGNYKEALRGTLGNIGLFGVSLNTVLGSLQKTRKGLIAYALTTKLFSKANQGGTRSLRAFRVALISTGMVLLSLY